MIEVFVVDDHSVVIEGLVTMLQSHPRIKIVGFSSNAKGCIEFLKRNEVDLVLCDINMPEISGIELCKQITNQYPKVKVVALSSYEQGRFIIDMIDNGASGYLLKNADKSEIILAIETVASGKKYVGFDIGKIYQSYKTKQSNIPRLTKREKEILKLVIQGLTSNDISKQLFISIDTVDSHRKNIYHKLGVSNLAGLIKYVTDNELI